jgi:hypothetical protein
LERRSLQQQQQQEEEEEETTTGNGGKSNRCELYSPKKGEEIEDKRIVFFKRFRNLQNTLLVNEVFRISHVRVYGFRV